MLWRVNIKNIIGTGFDDYVQKQINDRVEITNKQTRDSKDFLWLSNRNAWFRLSSGAQTTTLPDDQLIIKDLVKPLLQLEDEQAKINSSFQSDLAQLNVIQGGSIKVGASPGQVITKNTFSEAYTRNQNNIPGTDDLGFKPTPGITDVSVGTRGKWRTTLEADISIKAYNLEQLEIVNRLYMSLGVHVFLEWGHTPYIDNEGKVNTTPINPIIFFSPNTDRHKLLQDIEKKKKETSGNYGALLGRVTNFNYTAQIDGSYDCKIVVIGPGSMLESIRINKASGIDFDKLSKENESKKYKSDLHNTLESIKNHLIGLEMSFIKKDEYTARRGAIGRATKGIRISQFGSTSIGNNFVRPISTTNISGIESSPSPDIKSYSGLLTRIYSTCNYKGYKFEEGKIVYPQQNNESFAAYGNAWRYVSNLDKDGLNPIPLNLFHGFSARFSKNGGENVSFSDGEEEQYITFGHLLALLQHVCVFNETKGNITIGGDDSTRPVVYIDFHPDNTIMKTGPLQASLDPEVCMVPLKINTTGNDNEQIALGRFFSPLSTETETTDPKNLIKYKELNRINESILNTIPNSGGNYNKLMNVLVNINFAIETLNLLENNSSNKEVNLLEYITKILDGITLALGKINNFRVFFDDCSHVVRIIDEHRTEEIRDLIEIPNFGLKSLTYNYSFGSQISPKLAAQIVIAAQGQDGGIQQFPEDVLTYQKLNVNVRDKFAPKIIPSIPNDTRKLQEDQKQAKLKSLQKLFDQIFHVYTLDEQVESGTTQSLINLFADLNNVNEKYYPDKASTLLIPLTLDLEMDGLTGIMPYNAFLLPNDRLPVRYQNKGIAFIVFSIDHTFDSNQWKTKLTGQMIFRGENQTIERREPVQPVNTIKKSPLTPLNAPTLSTNYNLAIPTGNFDLKPNGLPGDNAVPEQENQTDLDPSPNISDNPTLLIIKFIEDNEGLAKIAYPDLIAAGQNGITADSGFVFRFKISNSGGTWDSKVEVNPGDKYRWVIGYGSNTITSLTGNVRFVKKGDTIDRNQAKLDLERRLKSEFIPKVKRACAANNVDYDQLPNKVKVVFVDCAYNYGTLWNDIIISYRDRGIQGLINELQRRIDRGSSQVPRRRAEEIRYLGGTPRI